MGVTGGAGRASMVTRVRRGHRADRSSPGVPPATPRRQPGPGAPPALTEQIEVNARNQEVVVIARCDDGPVSDETTAERTKRRRQRVLFDAIADLYDETRSGYPDEILDRLVETAGLGAGSRVLEVGCGTGQLTASLAARSLSITAIDIGAAMVARASGRVTAPDVSFRVTSFEDLDAPASSFDAIVSATAFHWIDPEVAWTKSARLLAPGGWIAILSTAERYDDPFATSFRDQWIRYSDDGGAWAKVPRPTLAERIASSGLFEAVVTSTHHERSSLPRGAVVDLERTRATVLSYEPDTRTRFLDELRTLLANLPEVPFTQESTLTMARVAPR
jgi:ubiquinone/menaquinone biosynthesis C-methylase UbiE